ncbi:MAG: nucleotidyl transferase AbiEii/AbiGii toxin family protein, partial [Myxococcales bacterium]
MTDAEKALRSATVDLSRAGARFALVGGLAVSARTEPRFTRDVDLAVAVDSDAEAEGLVRTLQECGYATLAVLEQAKTGRLATVRMSQPRTVEPQGIVDLLFASSGLEPEIVSAASPLAIVRGLDIDVAQRGHLVALKVLARDDDRRPQDRLDLLALLRGIDSAELSRAREGIVLIAQRGFDRDKDLQTELERALA